MWSEVGTLVDIGTRASNSLGVNPSPTSAASRATVAEEGGGEEDE